jgi:hypothetical protein
MDLGLSKKKVIVTGGSRVKSWNRFGWQRLPINRVNGKWVECLAFVVGGVLSIFMTPFEISGSKGSADVCAYIS